MAKIDKRTLTIRIGNSFTKLLTITEADGITPINLTGYAFKMQIRKCKSDAVVIYELNSPTEIDITDAVNGNIILKIDAVTTGTFSVQNAVYDLRWTTPAPSIDTILEGNVEILETVTK